MSKRSDSGFTNEHGIVYVLNELQESGFYFTEYLSVSFLSDSFFASFVVDNYFLDNGTFTLANFL